jgi:hypothetical protein
MRLRAAVARTRLPSDRDISRKSLTDMELEERAHHSTHGLANQTTPGMISSDLTTEITPGVFCVTILCSHLLENARDR